MFYATVGPAIQKYADTLKSGCRLRLLLLTVGTRLAVSRYTQEFAKAFTAMLTRASLLIMLPAPMLRGQILEAAIRKTQSLDREKLRDTLSSLDTMTVMGRYGVDRDGKQVRHFAVTVQWQKGKKEIVAPAELATAKPLWR